MEQPRTSDGRFDEKQFSQVHADEICRRLAEGESLQKICKSEHLPSRGTVYTWLRENEAFRVQHEIARQDQADGDVDEIKEIADDPNLAPDDKRVRIDARKWTAGKRKPTKYGEAHLLKIGNADGSNITLAGILGSLDGRTTGLPEIKGKTGGSDVEVK